MIVPGPGKYYPLHYMEDSVLNNFRKVQGGRFLKDKKLVMKDKDKCILYIDYVRSWTWTIQYSKPIHEEDYY